MPRANKKAKTGNAPVWSRSLSQLREAALPFQRSTAANHQHWSVSAEPFPLLQIPSLFNDKFLHSVKQQLLHQTTYFPRESDLFSFQGTHDLATVDEGSFVGRLRDAIYSSDFVDTLSDLTGIELTSQVDMSSHIYKQGDYLACHSDDIVEAEDARRIAFIIYFVEDWQPGFGGALNLFDNDASGNPGQIKHSVYPAWNTMALFEATPTSFHEVGEVLTSTQNRLSISGWFHGPLSSRLALREFAPRNVLFQSPNVPISNPTNIKINPKHQTSTAKQTLKEKFAESGSLTLPAFLNPKDFASLCDALAQDNPFEASVLSGPASVRRCYLLRDTSNTLVDGLLHFFRSSLIDWLEQVTSTTVSKHRVAARLFSQSCYQIIHDQGLDPLGLDVILTLGNGTQEPWNPKHGGRLTYTAALNNDSDEEEEDPISEALFSAWPEPNTLTIVLRDEGVLKSIGWVKNGVAGLKGRVDIEAVYLLRRDAEGDDAGSSIGADEEEEFEGIPSD